MNIEGPKQYYLPLNLKTPSYFLLHFPGRFLFETKLNLEGTHHKFTTDVYS